MTTTHTGNRARTDETPVVTALREKPDNPHLLGGFGPLVVGVLLVVLMTILAPTVAPEGVVVQPRTTPTTDLVEPAP